MDHPVFFVPSRLCVEEIVAVKADAVYLAAADPVFARAAGVAGDFPLVLRPPGFGALLRIILEQQVSTAAANAMWVRLTARLGAEPTPKAFLALDEAALRACGFSRQKANYGRGLAEAVLAGTVDLDAIAAMDDDSAIAALSAVKGIGRWSAECYLLWALGRRDILPASDMALQVGWQWLSGAAERPSADALCAAAEPWRPRRTAATLLIWHYYLGVLAERGSPAPPLAKPKRRR